jgi:tripartite-type tricarboxylate transporter receptor subunit TctC
MKRHLLSMLVMLAALPASAQDYQSSTAPVTIKVGYAAGGAADIAVRKMLPGLQAALKRPVVAENLGGAGGAVATAATLAQQADGNTLLCVTGDDFTLAPFGPAGSRYRTDQLRFVYPLRFVDLVLVSSLEKAPSGVAEFVEMAKKARQPYSFGNWGPGSSAHIAAADLRGQAGVDTIDVPYKGGAPMLQAILAGQIDFAFLPLNGQLIEMIKAGKVKSVFVASGTRSAYLPQTPHAAEGQLLKDFQYKIWPAIFVHRSTPEKTVEAIHHAIASVVDGTEYREWARSTGAADFTPMSLAQAQAFVKAEQERIARVIKKVDIPAN